MSHIGFQIVVERLAGDHAILGEAFAERASQIKTERAARSLGFQAPGFWNDRFARRAGEERDMGHQRHVRPRFLGRHRNADKLPAVALAGFDLLGVAVQDARPHFPRPRIDLSHAPAEARIHDDERIDRLGVEPR